MCGFSTTWDGLVNSTKRCSVYCSKLLLATLQIWNAEFAIKPAKNASLFKKYRPGAQASKLFTMNSNAANAIRLELVVALLKAKDCVAFTGVGVSVGSGIRTFRDTPTGLWACFNADDLAHPTPCAMTGNSSGTGSNGGVWKYCARDSYPGASAPCASAP